MERWDQKDNTYDQNVKYSHNGLNKYLSLPGGKF